MDKNVMAARMATLARVAKALEENRMEAHVVESREALLEALEKMLPKGASIASGGSMTLAETGVNGLLQRGDYDFYFRGRTGADGQPVDVYRAAFSYSRSRSRMRRPWGVFSSTPWLHSDASSRWRWR